MPRGLKLAGLEEGTLDPRGSRRCQAGRWESTYLAAAPLAVEAEGSSSR